MWRPCALREALLELRIASLERNTAGVNGPATSPTECWRDRDGGIVAQGYSTTADYRLRFPHFATYRFGRTPGAVTAIPEAATSIEALRDRHRRSVLPLALQALGLETLHASGIALPEGVIALCGFPRTGKSTIAYGLHRRGYTLWADDSVVFYSGHTIETIPLPFLMRLRPASLAHFGPAALPFDLGGQLPERRPASGAPAPLAAVFILTRSGPDENAPGRRLQRLGRAASFQAVLAHAQCFSLRERARKQRMLRTYLTLADQVPVVELGFQPGFAKLASVLDAIEQEIGAIVSGAL